MDATQIIIRPLVTEKSTWETNARNRYTFEVHPDANKFMIRQAVEFLYNVKVDSVATQNRMGKLRRTRFGLSRARGTKKAVVQLKGEDRIDLF